MEFSRRLITFLVTIASLVSLVASQVNVTELEILTITAVGVVTLLGYNGEDWIKATRAVRRLADVVDAVADAMEDVQTDKEV